MLSDMVSLITKHLKKGNRLRLSGPGASCKSGTAPPDGTQPGDRRSYKIKASKKVAFRAAKDLKEAI